MKHLSSVCVLSACSLLALAIPACDDTKSAADSQRGATAALPAALMATTEPVGALKILDARKAAPKEGDRVAVIGRIGGKRAPFVSNKAVFTIVDPTLQSCVEMGDADHCPRPWDYCCEEKTALANAMASVEVVGADGKPLPIALATEGTLKPLMLVAVEGTVQGQEGGVFLIRAERIYRYPNDPLADHIK
ncbi:MAG: hypothetical protein EXS03_08605 [Phycisphaerales bacterium]|nr:hypothetical protein [Phycisphaerales bacterium]